MQEVVLFEGLEALSKEEKEAGTKARTTVQRADTHLRRRLIVLRCFGNRRAIEHGRLGKLWWIGLGWGGGGTFQADGSRFLGSETV